MDINRRKELGRWVDMINAEQPDLVLIAGDIIDGSIRPLVDQQMYSEFLRLRPYPQRTSVAHILDCRQDV